MWKEKQTAGILVLVRLADSLLSIYFSIFRWYSLGK